MSNHLTNQKTSIDSPFPVGGLDITVYENITVRNTKELISKQNQICKNK